MLNLNADSSGYLLKRDRVMQQGGRVRALSENGEIEGGYAVIRCRDCHCIDGMENITAWPVFEQNMAGMK